MRRSRWGKEGEWGDSVRLFEGEGQVGQRRQKTFGSLGRPRSTNLQKSIRQAGNVLCLHSIRNRPKLKSDAAGRLFESGKLLSRLHDKSWHVGYPSTSERRS